MSTTPTPHRVRVTGPRRARRGVSRTVDIGQDSELANLYLRSLMRAQLFLALRVLGVLALVAGLIPAGFAVFPVLADLRVGVVPLAFWVVGPAMFVLLLVLGRVFVIRAEHNEARFVELTAAADDDQPGTGADGGSSGRRT